MPVLFLMQIFLSLWNDLHRPGESVERSVQLLGFKKKNQNHCAYSNTSKTTGQYAPITTLKTASLSNLVSSGTSLCHQCSPTLPLCKVFKILHFLSQRDKSISLSLKPMG